MWFPELTRETPENMSIETKARDSVNCNAHIVTTRVIITLHQLIEYIMEIYQLFMSESKDLSLINGDPSRQYYDSINTPGEHDTSVNENTLYHTNQSYLMILVEFTDNNYQKLMHFVQIKCQWCC